MVRYREMDVLVVVSDCLDDSLHDFDVATERRQDEDQMDLARRLHAQIFDSGADYVVDSEEKRPVECQSVRVEPVLDSPEPHIELLFDEFV